MELKINIFRGHLLCLAWKFTEDKFLKEYIKNLGERFCECVFDIFEQLYFIKSLYLAYLGAPRGQEEDCGSNLFQKFVNIIQISQANNKLPFSVLADTILALPTSCSMSTHLLITSQDWIKNKIISNLPNLSSIL